MWRSLFTPADLNREVEYAVFLFNKTESDSLDTQTITLKTPFVGLHVCFCVELFKCVCTRHLPCSGKLRTVVGVTWPPIFRVPLEPNVNLLAGDDIGLKPGFSAEAKVGGSSPKRRRLALPAAGELYLSWTDRGDGGTSGGWKEVTAFTRLLKEPKLKTVFFLKAKGKTMT